MFARRNEVIYRPNFAAMIKEEQIWKSRTE